MIKQELLNYEIHLGDKHIADFDDLEMAKCVVNASIKAGKAERAIIISKWTGEVLYDVAVKVERKVVPFDYSNIPDDDRWEFG